MEFKGHVDVEFAGLGCAGIVFPLRNFFVFLLAIIVLFATIVWIRYGGGDHYPDLTTRALLEESALTEVLNYPEPIGNVAVSDDGRLFFTVHPEARPQGNKLLEWVDGAAQPYPSGTVQPHLFDSILGIQIDRQQRLWTIDHGSLGFGQPRLLAFDLRSGDLVHDHEFTDLVAPLGSFLQDLRVTPDGNFVVIADGSILRKEPALVVYDVQQRRGRRVLQQHKSVVAENYLIRNPIRDIRYFAGLFTMKCGVNGIDIDRNGEWLYFAAINNGAIYRLRLANLLDPLATDTALAGSVELFARKPLSDGIHALGQDSVLVGDVEHNAVSILHRGQSPATLLRSSDLRWASSLVPGPDGKIYVSDSAFPELPLQTRDHIAAKGPYSIFAIDLSSISADTQ